MVAGVVITVIVRLEQIRETIAICIAVRILAEQNTAVNMGFLMYREGFNRIEKLSLSVTLSVSWSSGTLRSIWVELKWTPAGLHPNCKKRLKKVRRLTQNTTCPHGLLRRGST
jgi:hypothetical protein